MTETSDTSGMTCGRWLLLVVLGILGVFGLFLFNMVQTEQDNRSRQVQEIFDLLQADDTTEAFDRIAEDWQRTVETPDQFANLFADTTVTNIRLNGSMGTCYTNMTIRNGEWRITNDSVRYQYLEGSATINDNEGEYIYVRLTPEDGATKLLGVELDDTDYGQHIPDDCRYD